MKTRSQSCHKILRRKLISLAVASCFASGVAEANPTNPVVVNGTVAMQQSGNLLSITNSPNAIINWGSFSIGANEITRFIQQSQASAVLNRVVGQDPSAILGALQSNGRVFLINPNGIVFGAGSQIDVAGLVASTLNLSDADFLAGRLRFTETLNAGSVVNQGSITTGAGGSVYLVAPDITNSGIITSPKGEVILAAGRSVELVDPGTPNLRVEISAPDTQARNLGQIMAEAGRVGIYAGLINHSGTIQANSAVLGERGEIVLKATQNATLEAGSLTTANGTEGGKITIQSGDTTLVSGTVEARGTQGAGGTVQILGNLVGLTGSAAVDASGETGGGTVLVGGDYQGKNPDIQNAYRTYFGPDASIKADAITSGDGGRVIVWGDDATRAYGSISARGGSQSGNGGFVEVSGKNWLDFAASVDTRAPYGSTGTLLLDPTNVFIADNQANATAFGMSGTDTSINSSGPSLFAASGTPTDSLLLTSTLTSALASNSVVVSTASASTSGVGNIGVADPIVWNSANSLTLLAQNKIISRGITNSGSGAINMYAGWDGVSTVTPVVTAGVGHDILITQSIQTGGNIQLTAGNDITVQPSLATLGTPPIVVIGSTFSITPVAVSAGGAFVATAGNDFTLQGALAKATATSSNVLSDSSASITANAITITAGGDLTIAGGDNSLAKVTGVGSGQTFTATAISNATLSATTNINLTGQNILIRGGENASFGQGALASSNSGVGNAIANSKAMVSAGGGISLNGTTSVTVRGGDNAVAVASDNAGTVPGRGNATADASAAVSAGTSLTVTGGSLSVRGGNNSLASATSGSAGINMATATANTSLLAGTANIIVSGPVSIQGGSDAFARTRGSDGGGQFGATVNAKALVQATNNLTLTVTSGDLIVTGGAAAIASGTEAAGQHTLIVNADAELSAGGNLQLNVNSGNLTVRGGDNANVRISGSPGVSLLQTQVNSRGKIAGGTIALTASGTLTVRGGNNASASASLDAGAVTNIAMNAKGSVESTGGINISAGNLAIAGGSNTTTSVTGSGASAASTTVIVDGLVSGAGITLAADAMDIQGSVNAGANILTVVPTTAGLPIELGTLTDPASVLALSNAELGNLTGSALVIGDLGATPITITNPLTFVSPPSLLGSTITQTPGSTITGSSLTLSATGAITLNETNDVGALFAQTFGAPLQFATSGTLDVGASITTNNGDIVLTAGGDINVDNALDAGTATVTLTSTGGAIVDNHAGTDIIASAATLAAATGIASAAAPLQTQLSSLTAGSSGGEIGILNTGNLAFGISSFGGSNIKIQTSGALTTSGAAFNATGSVSLLGSGMNIGQGLNAAGNLLLDAGAGNLAISGVSVEGFNVTLNGANIDIGNATASAATSVLANNAATLTTTGNLTLQGGAGTGASAAVDSIASNTSVTTGGDVRVRGGSGPGAYAALTGGPDLFMTVGGAVRMDAGSSASEYARIASTSPNSIHVLFPNLALGGYFVNGVEYTVYDILSASGFMAGGLPAIFGNNLLITYGLSAPSSLLPPVITTTNNPVDLTLQGGYPIDPVLSDGEGLTARGEETEISTGREYIGIWGVVDGATKEMICR